MKSNEDRFLGNRGIKYNRSQKPQRTPIFPDTQDTPIDKGVYTKANSSLNQPNGGRVYYSAWKEALQK